MRRRALIFRDNHEAVVNGTIVEKVFYIVITAASFYAIKNGKYELP